MINFFAVLGAIWFGLWVARTFYWAGRKLVAKPGEKIEIEPPKVWALGPFRTPARKPEPKKVEAAWTFETLTTNALNGQRLLVEARCSDFGGREVVLFLEPAETSYGSNLWLNEHGNVLDVGRYDDVDSADKAWKTHQRRDRIQKALAARGKS